MLNSIPKMPEKIWIYNWGFLRTILCSTCLKPLSQYFCRKTLTMASGLATHALRLGRKYHLSLYKLVLLIKLLQNLRFDIEDFFTKKYHSSNFLYEQVSDLKTYCIFRHNCHKNSFSFYVKKVWISVYSSCFRTQSVYSME